VNTDIQTSAKVIADRAPGFKPAVGMVLGSGLGPFADTIENRIVISYADLPGFPKPGVAGHAGQLVLGTVGGTCVAVMQGREHFYETGKADAMKTPVRTLHAIGCETLVVTNAAGSTVEAAGPGSVMMITDHIAFTGQSPLFGEEGNDRFVDLSQAYDADHQTALREIAKAKNIAMAEGIYMWFCGPHFETPAEIKMSQILGASAVGMSTVPEVILARHIGMRVAALSIITNLAAGMSDVKLSHEQTMTMAAKAADDVQVLLTDFLSNY
jgi:purine-nucleoside phosphorylase